ncbi:DUF6440 family protein [Lysinibacillus sp. UGB7]|uniref:DUF6440 family protein n=1 Tax=Lysinibacillus sp. UGB7 TaxID=3411039 RepID=UPI003B776E5D
MKKILAGLSLCILLTGCSTPYVETKADDNGEVSEQKTPKTVSSITQISQLKRGFYFYVDEETGCQYIIYKDDGDGGITPRLNNNGQPMCNVDGQ